MLAKQFRLNKSYDFDRVFKKSKPFFSKNLSMRFIQRNSDRPSHFGFIVSNKVDKRSVRRNALKRQLRAIVQEYLPTINPAYDVVITVKRDFDFPYDQKQIKSQVTDLLMQAKALK